MNGSDEDDLRIAFSKDKMKSELFAWADIGAES